MNTTPLQSVSPALHNTVAPGKICRIVIEEFAEFLFFVTNEVYNLY